MHVVLKIRKSHTFASEVYRSPDQWAGSSLGRADRRWHLAGCTSGLLIISIANGLGQSRTGATRRLTSSTCVNARINGVHRPQRVIGVDGAMEAKRIVDDTLEDTCRIAEAARNCEVTVCVVD